MIKFMLVITSNLVMTFAPFDTRKACEAAWDGLLTSHAVNGAATHECKAYGQGSGRPIKS